MAASAQKAKAADKSKAKAKSKVSANSAPKLAAVPAPAPSPAPASAKAKNRRPDIYQYGKRVTIPEGQRADGSPSGRTKVIAIIQAPELAAEFVKLAAKFYGIEAGEILVR